MIRVDTRDVWGVGAGGDPHSYFCLYFTFSRLVDDWMGVLEWVDRDDMREISSLFPWIFLREFVCVWKIIYFLSRIGW